MGDLFKALGSGLARFVYAWLMPSIITVGVFIWIVVPQLPFNVPQGAFLAVAAFTLAVLGLSVVFAYASRAIYQFFEGYTMPAWLAKPLLQRARKRFVRLQAAARSGRPPPRSLQSEDILAYPDTLEKVLPTRLGNALRGMETYGVSRFGLDSQTFWYELRAIANEDVRKSVEESRAAVDFFMSSLAHLIALSVVSALSAPFARQPAVPLLVAAVAAALAPGAYAQAVRNVGEWRWAVQAMVNTSRSALAQSLGLQMPNTYAAETKMWESVAGMAHYGPDQHYLKVLDPLRAPGGT